MTLEAKCDRVKKLITDYPLWWETAVTDMSLDLLVKLGADPRDEKYFQLTVLHFIRVTDALDKGDEDTNEVTKKVTADVYPTVDFHKLGFQDDIVAEGKMMHQQWLLEDLYDDDPALDRLDDRLYDEH